MARQLPKAVQKLFVVVKYAEKRKCLCKEFVYTGPWVGMTFIVIKPSVFILVVAWFYNRPCGSVMCDLMGKHNPTQVISGIERSSEAHKQLST